MKIQRADPSSPQKRGFYGDSDGIVAAYSVSGQQAKAMPSTLKTPNATKFYKGYQKKLVEHQEENKEHFRSIYGGDTKENTDMNKKKKIRP
jgi:hypothetical protein